MARALDVRDTTDRAAAHTSRSYPTNGHHKFGLWGMAKSAGGAPAGTLKLQGSMTPDQSAGSVWDDLVTLSFTGNQQKQGMAVEKPYPYVRVDWSAVTDLTLDEWRVHAVGWLGTV